MVAETFTVPTLVLALPLLLAVLAGWTWLWFRVLQPRVVRWIERLAYRRLLATGLTHDEARTQLESWDIWPKGYRHADLSDVSLPMCTCEPEIPDRRPVEDTADIGTVSDQGGDDAS